MEELTALVYPENTAPVIKTATASPANLTLPDSSTALSATTRDADGDVITRWWRVKSRPAGVKLTFTKQSGRDTNASGLTVGGSMYSR